MTQTAFPFDNNLAYEVQWTKMARKWLNTGVLKSELNEYATFADSTGMQVKVPSGRAWLEGHFHENDAQLALAISASDVTNPRIDRVVLHLDWANNLIDLRVLTGTPAVTPSAPAVTQNSTIWEISLATVAVGAGVSTITAGNVTDTRTFVQNVDINATQTLANKTLLSPVMTSPQISSGNLAFTTTAQRITGDMSNATHVNRLMFQTNLLNGLTALSVLPNGTSTVSVFTLYNKSDPDNSGLLQLSLSGVTGSISASIRGTGSIPTTFAHTGFTAYTFDATVNGTAAAFTGDVSVARLDLTGTGTIFGGSTGFDFRNTGDTASLLTISTAGLGTFLAGITANGPFTVNATGSLFSAGANTATTVTVGGGGTGGASLAYLYLKAPSTNTTTNGDAQVLFYRGATSVWQIGIDSGVSGAKSAGNDFFFYCGSVYVAAFSTSGQLTTQGPHIVNATGSVFSAGTNADSSLSIGSGGGSPTAPRTAYLYLNAPHGGSGTGTASVRHQRAGSDVWVVGIDNTGSSGAKAANTDYAWHNGSAYVAALSTAGAFKTSGGLVSTTLSLTGGNIDASGNTGLAGYLRIGSTSAVDNAAIRVQIDAVTAGGGVTVPFSLKNTAGVADTKFWDWYFSGAAELSLRATSDNYSAANTIYKVVRSGYTISSHTWYVGSSTQALQIDSTGTLNLYATNPNILAQTTNASVYIKSNGTGAIYLNNDAGGDVHIGRSTKNAYIDADNLIQAGGYHSIGSSPPATGTIRLTSGGSIYADGFNGITHVDTRLIDINSYQIRIGDGNNTSMVITPGALGLTIGNQTTISNGALIVGAPTGGITTTGSINVATNVYKNGTAYISPDFVFELAFTNEVSVNRNQAWKHYQRLMGDKIWSLDDIRKHVSINYRFPIVTDKPTGIFTDNRTLGRDDISLVLHEMTYLYLFKHEDMLGDHESRINELERENRELRETVESLRSK